MGIDGGRTDCLWLHTEANRGRDVGHNKRRNWIRGQILGQTDGEYVCLGIRRHDNRGITISNRTNMTNNKQKTAVEWLFAELKNHLDMPSHHANEILEQAKEMEKEQMKIAFEIYRDLLSHYEDGSAFEQYYNETYGGGDQ